MFYVGELPCCEPRGVDPKFATSTILLVLREIKNERVGYQLASYMIGILILGMGL